jgi:hypothetical protein
VTLAPKGDDTPSTPKHLTVHPGKSRYRLWYDMKGASTPYALVRTVPE